jgi:alkanesulfonate monooxygenase SsuD/methylene tetrahydromethanopterin reductase-like flavin-dependent oxidoreductase (luciferase family)
MATKGKQPRMKFGIQTAQQLVTYDQLKECWQAADELGLYSAWCHDHFLPASVKEPVGPCMEGWTTLTALLSHTKSLRGGLFVAGNTYRHPSIFAKAATTLDNITQGRVELGIGAGWYELEHTTYGVPFYTTAERIHRLDEAVQVFKKLWALKPGEKANFQGKYYQLKDAPMDPPPIQKPHPPILIGWGGEKLTLRVVAKWADQIGRASCRERVS